MGLVALNTPLIGNEALEQAIITINNAVVTMGTPGGSDTQIQYNNSGSFAGSANLIFIADSTSWCDLLLGSSTTNGSSFSFSAGNSNSLNGGSGSAIFGNCCTMSAHGSIVFGDTCSHLGTTGITGGLQCIGNGHCCIVIGEFNQSYVQDQAIFGFNNLANSQRGHLVAGIRANTNVDATQIFTIGNGLIDSPYTSSNALYLTYSDRKSTRLNSSHH
jgi:hypothetical protein